MTDIKTQAETLPLTADAFLKWEATPLTRVSIPAQKGTKTGQLVVSWKKETTMTINKPTKHYGANGFQYKPQHGVVVLCENEKHQQSIYETLKKQGLKLKVVTV